MTQAEVIHRACNLCEAICGLRFHVQDNVVTRIEADPADPLSQGHICPKAAALADLDTSKFLRPFIY